MAAGRNPGFDFIPQLAEEGLSANQALGRLRDAGFGVRRQSFLRAYGDYTRGQAARSDVSRADPTRAPIPSEVTPFQSPGGREGYLYSVNVMVEDPEAGMVFTTPSGYRTGGLVTHGEAISGAVQALTDAQADRGSLPGLRVLGGYVTEVREFVPTIEEE